MAKRIRQIIVVPGTGGKPDETVLIIKDDKGSIISKQVFDIDDLNQYEYVSDLIDSIITSLTPQQITALKQKIG